MCPAFKVTREEMKEQSFIAFVKEKFRQHPDLPAFKIVPPIGWNPTRKETDLDSMVIGTPIQQLVRMSSLDVPRDATHTLCSSSLLCRHSARRDLIDACWLNKRYVTRTAAGQRAHAHWLGRVSPWQ